jgi:hypothetical protein
VARGTFRTSHYGLRFFYQHTLGRGWVRVPVDGPGLGSAKLPTP